MTMTYKPIAKLKFNALMNRSREIYLLILAKKFSAEELKRHHESLVLFMIMISEMFSHLRSEQCKQ